MKLRIGSHTELGITAERNYLEQDRHFALFGIGWDRASKAFAWLSIYFLVWRIELYVDYEDIEDKWGYVDMNVMSDVENEIEIAFNKLRLVKE